MRSGCAPPVAVVTTCSSCRAMGDIASTSDVVSPERTMTLSTVLGANPIRAVTDTVYRPTGRFVRRYAPSATDLVDPDPPPPERTAVTVAPVSGSPDTFSVTRPLIPPVCAAAGRAAIATTNAAHDARRNRRGFSSLRPRKTNFVDMHGLQGGNTQAGVTPAGGATRSYGGTRELQVRILS